jgi:hypothetical protein
LYRIVALSSMWMMASNWPRFSFDRLLGLIRNKPATFYNTSVHHLLIDDMFSLLEPASLSTVAFTCCGVKDLFVNVPLSPLLPFFNHLTSLRRLGVSLKRLFGGLAIDFTHHLFANITHLDVFDRETAQIPEGLSLIPNLTHCAFNQAVFLDKTPHILQTCPKLRYLIFLMTSVDELSKSDDRAEWWAALANDLRFVALVRGHFRVDWILGAQSGQDFWARAERFVALRRAGKIDREPRQISTVSD